VSAPIIRLMTCGSVDDGKSTLIGRLLVETDSVPDDTVDAARHFRRSGSTIDVGDIDFSLLTDGLEAERDQGITIDVAYRSMTLPNGSRLIIADGPGHEQYTRNMAVAASRADIGLVLLDVTKGVRTQTHRHLNICAIMNIPRVILVVNKMDRVDYKEESFRAVESQLKDALLSAGIKEALCIPISALKGENVTSASVNMDWYTGPTLFDAIQTEASIPENVQAPRVRVQHTIRSGDFRGVAGTLLRGNLSVGDQVVAFPSMKSAHISRIANFDCDRSTALDGDAVTLELSQEIDISRGQLLLSENESVTSTQEFSAKLVWMNEKPLTVNRSYMLISGFTHSPAAVIAVTSQVDVTTGQDIERWDVGLNAIANVKIVTDLPLALLPYKTSRDFGNFILVDRQDFQTVACGIVEHIVENERNTPHQDYEISSTDRANQKNQRPCVVWLTGIPGSGKSTIADALDRVLHLQGKHSYVLDGDNLRNGLNSDLGFSETDRHENARRVGEVAKLLTEAGLIVIVALVSPFEDDRRRVRDKFSPGEFFEVFVDTPVDVCANRDPKGHYLKAASGEISNFTGVGQMYERPTTPEIVVHGVGDIQANVKVILTAMNLSQSDN
jgi:bifunctional enzyme CysN/CysC